MAAILLALLVASLPNPSMVVSMSMSSVEGGSEKKEKGGSQIWVKFKKTKFIKEWDRLTERTYQTEFDEEEQLSLKSTSVVIA